MASVTKQISHDINLDCELLQGAVENPSQNTTATVIFKSCSLHLIRKGESDVKLKGNPDLARISTLICPALHGSLPTIPASCWSADVENLRGRVMSVL